MKNTFIFGMVWLAIIVGLVSFGATVFLLEDNEKPKVSSSIASGIEEKEIVYKTNQTAIRTNEMASIEKNNSKKENEMKNNNMQKYNENSKQNNIQNENEKLNHNVNKNEKNLEENTEEKNIEVVSNDVISFVRPVKGEVLRPLSIDELIYSKTLNEWNVHHGTDYKTKIGEEVVAIQNGKVKQIGENDKYGEFIVIEHSNGYESLYANLTVLDALVAGSSVKKGQLIGYVAESFGFEVAEETHIHLELKKDGKYISI